MVIAKQVNSIISITRIALNLKSFFILYITPFKDIKVAFLSFIYNYKQNYIIKSTIYKIFIILKFSKNSS